MHINKLPGCRPAFPSPASRSPPLPTLFSDPSTTTYTLACVAVAAALFAWWRARSRNALVAVGVTLGLLVGLFALDRLFESPREQAVRAVRAMGDAANAGDWPGVGSHVSDSFRYGTRTKAEFLGRAASSARAYNANVTFTAFDREQAVPQPGGGVRIGFVAQLRSPQAANPFLTYVEATFAPDAAGRQAMTGLTFFEYIQRQTPLSLPGL